MTTSGLPDPLFRIQPETDPDFFLNQYPAGTGFGSFFQIKIRPEPDPDLFFKLISGRIQAKTGRS